MSEGCDYAAMDGNHGSTDHTISEAARQAVPIDPTATDFMFAIVRQAYTYGRSLVDTTATRDRDAWARAGRPFGAYMILGMHEFDPEPEVQVQTFIDAYGDRRPGELPPALDLEADSARALNRTPAECLAWAERAEAALSARYGRILVYTSARVWIDVFGGLASYKLGRHPLWVKIPYPYAVNQPPHPEACPTTIPNDEIPLPWRVTPSPGAWIVQYQGDSKGSKGCTGTMDRNRFLLMQRGETGIRVQWLQGLLGSSVLDKPGTYQGSTALAVKARQVAAGLDGDSVIGPKSFVMFTA